MEYIYSVLLLHSTGQQVNETNVKKVLESAGIKAEDVKIKALVSALEGVNIDEVIKQAAMPVTAAPVAQEKKAEEKAKPSVEEEAKKAEEAASGLASLFG